MEHFAPHSILLRYDQVVRIPPRAGEGEGGCANGGGRGWRAHIAPFIHLEVNYVGTQYSRPQDEVSEEVKRSETSNQDDSVNKERRQNETSRNKEAKMGDFDNWDVTFDNQMRKWPLRGCP